MMCRTGVILSIPFYSLLSQKHKPAFFFQSEKRRVGQFLSSLDPDTNLKALKSHGPNVWELPSPQGIQIGE